MTDILDLKGWTVLSKTQSGGEEVIEAEYTVQPTNCPKCGVVDTPYKHGVKPIKYRDSPIRGNPVSILANVRPADWHAMDAAYNRHHFNCTTCIAAGRGSRYGLRCGTGAALWRAYSEA